VIATFDGTNFVVVLVIVLLLSLWWISRK